MKKNIYQILRERKNLETTELLIMPEKPPMYWIALPIYAHQFIRPAYDEINDFTGLLEFVHYFLLQHSITNNQEKKLSIECVVFPLYNQITGRNFETQLIAL